MTYESAKLRIQKHLGAMGVGSRRAVEQMIIDGRITLNGKLITDLPCFVDPAADDIRVDGRAVSRRRPQHVYFLLNKPKGVVCTQSDPQNRPRAVDLIPPIRQRIYCVGRLDADSTGLIILTNDGALTQRVTHPRYGVAKTYVVQVDGALTGDQLQKLRNGMWLDGVRTQPAHVRVVRRGRNASLLQIRLTEGRNREIRRVLARLGHRVRRLSRVAIGQIRDRGLKVGNFRTMTPQEVAKLTRTAQERPPRRRR